MQMKQMPLQSVWQSGGLKLFKFAYCGYVNQEIYKLASSLTNTHNAYKYYAKYQIIKLPNGQISRQISGILPA